jgi:hypothetical protein
MNRNRLTEQSRRTREPQNLRLSGNPTHKALVRKSILEIAETIEPGPRPFKTWQEMDNFLRSERDAWDR